MRGCFTEPLEYVMRASGFEINNSQPLLFTAGFCELFIDIDGTPAGTFGIL